MNNNNNTWFLVKIKFLKVIFTDDFVNIINWKRQKVYNLI